MNKQIKVIRHADEGVSLTFNKTERVHYCNIALTKAEFSELVSIAIVAEGLKVNSGHTECPHCNCNELLCGYPKKCSSASTKECDYCGEQGSRHSMKKHDGDYYHEDCLKDYIKEDEDGWLSRLEPEEK